MNWLYKLERKLGRFAIPNLMMYICITTFAVYILAGYLVGPQIINWITLDRAALFQGQIWRLITFVFMPPQASLLWALLALYFYFIIGRALEDAWGAFKFNVYYLCGMLGIVLAALISGYGTPTDLNLTLFLAYAAIYPNNEVLLFFIIPIKVKYLAYVDWVLLAVRFIMGPGYVRVSIVFSLLNFLLFFGPGIVKQMKDNKKYAAQRRQFRKAMQENKDRSNGTWR